MMRNKFIHLLLGLCWWAGVLSLGGCAAEESSAQNAAPETNCNADRDCPASQMCRAGLCSVRTTAQTELNFRFIPPSSTDFLPQHIEAVQVRSDQKLDFGLERGITVNSGEAANNGDNGGQAGGIRYANNPLNGPSGTLLFRRAGVDDQLFSREARVDRGDFNARITPGRYSLTFVPEDRSELPKKTWPEEVFESNTYLLRTLRAPEDLIVVDGTLSRDVTLSEGATIEGEAVAGARVYAISTDGRHTSTVVTSNERGKFELRVEPSTGTYDLFVVPTAANPNVVHTEFEAAFEVTEDKCIPESGGEGNPCRLSRNLGAYPAEPVEVQIGLEAPEEFDDEDALDGATVVVSGTVATGTYTRKHEVEFFDQQGRWGANVLLYPAAWSLDEMPRYSLQIVPPTRSPFARTEVVVEGQLDLSALHSFEVDLKRQVVGQVVDAQGAAVSAAKLDFRIADQGGSFDTREIAVTTDHDGRFEVWLERADYDVFIVAPPVSGQPRMRTSIEADEVRAGDELVFELPRPAVIVGSVFGAMDAAGEQFIPVADVTVEAYKVVEGRTVVFGQARTDANGEFRMAISSKL